MQGLHYYVRQTVELVRFLNKLTGPILSGGLSPTAVSAAEYVYEKQNCFSKIFGNKLFDGTK